MDTDIKNEFAAVRADIRMLTLECARLTLECARLTMRVREVDAQVREVDTRLATEIRRVEATLRQEVREEGIATRRHFDVVAESLRDDIRIIAEGVIAVDAKVETSAIPNDRRGKGECEREMMGEGGVKRDVMMETDHRRR